MTQREKEFSARSFSTITKGRANLLTRVGAPFVIERQVINMEAHSSATISACGRYRYELIRQWGPTAKLCRFIMLNPSTADATEDDPTIRRCIAFAKAWGYDGIVVHNLYAYRATNPAELVNADDPIGDENRNYLASDGFEFTIAAWGSHPAASIWWHGYPYAWQKTILRNRALHCLGVNGNGSPKHPLYLAASCTPRPWKAP